MTWLPSTVDLRVAARVLRRVIGCEHLVDGVLGVGASGVGGEAGGTIGSESGSYVGIVGVAGLKGILEGGGGRGGAGIGVMGLGSVGFSLCSIVGRPVGWTGAASQTKGASMLWFWY